MRVAPHGAFVEPSGRNQWQSAANNPGRKDGGNKRNPLPWVATCCRDPKMVSRASAVGCHPLREVPSLRGRRSIPVGIIERDYFLAQSGHGHWSQPQPVHASRIMGAFYPPDDPGDARTVQPVSTWVGSPPRSNSHSNSTRTTGAAGSSAWRAAAARRDAHGWTEQELATIGEARTAT
jgi:hypothetical protein